jgi:hypothetical protein
MMDNSCKCGLLALLASSASLPVHASVVTPGENPGQYNISVYIDNDSELPYPESGLVRFGVLRYESDWLDEQLKAWRDWVGCEETLRRRPLASRPLSRFAASVLPHSVSGDDRGTELRPSGRSYR